MSEVLDVTIFLSVMELLMLVFLSPLIEVAWDSWEVVETCGTDSVFVFTGDDQWGILLLSS